MKFWEFADIFWFPKILSLKVIWQLITNNPASFHLWWKENLLSQQKVSKHYELDCKILFCFLCLLTALIVNNSHILAGLHFIFLKEHPRPNLKPYHYPIWTLVNISENTGKFYRFFWKLVAVSKALKLWKLSNKSNLNGSEAR